MMPARSQPTEPEVLQTEVLPLESPMPPDLVQRRHIALYRLWNGVIGIAGGFMTWCSELVQQPEKAPKLDHQLHLTINDVRQKMEQLETNSTGMTPHLQEQLHSLLNSLVQQAQQLHNAVHGGVAKNIDDTLNEMKCLESSCQWLYKICGDVLELEKIGRFRPAILQKGSQAAATIEDQTFSTSADWDTIPAHTHLKVLNCHVTCLPVHQGKINLSGGLVKGSTFTGVKVIASADSEAGTGQIEEWQNYISRLQKVSLPARAAPCHLKPFLKEGYELQNQIIRGDTSMSLNGGRLQGCDLSEVVIRASGPDAVSGVQFDRSTLRHCTIQEVWATNWLIRGIPHETTLKGGAIDSTQIDNSELEDVTWLDGEIRRSAIRKSRLHNVSITGVIWTESSFEQCIFENVIFTDGQFEGYVFFSGIMRSLQLIRPVFGRGCELRGSFSNLVLHEADLSSTVLRADVQRLVLVDCRGKFANQREVDRFIQEGQIVVESPMPDPFEAEEKEEKSDEITKVVLQGQEIMTSTSDRKPNLLRRARENFQRYRLEILTKYRDALRKEWQESEDMIRIAHLLVPFGFLPFRVLDLEEILSHSLTYSPDDDEAFSSRAIESLRKTHDLDQAMEHFIHDRKSHGYLHWDHGTLRRAMGAEREHLVSQNHIELVTNTLYQHFVEGYQGASEDFPTSLRDFLGEALPHLLPIDPVWACAQWRQYHEPNEPQGKARDEYLEMEAQRLNRIEGKLALVREKLTAVRNNPDLDVQQRADEEDVWQRELDRLMEWQDSTEAPNPTEYASAPAENTVANLE